MDLPTVSIIKSGIKKFYSFRFAPVLTVSIAITLLFFAITPGHTMLSSGIVQMILRIAPELGLIAVGITVLMICQEFDLSVGSVLAFSSMVMVWSYTELNLNLALCMIITLAAGCLIGLLNGLITVKFRIPSFITTLGMMMFWRGIVLAISGGRPMAFHPEETSPVFKSMLIGEIGGIPMQFIWFLVIVVVLALLLEHHRFGNRVRATGGNKEATRAMGVNTDRIKIICFMIVGLLVAFAGVIQATRIVGSNPLQGRGLELEAIAATVIGGTLLFGGVGTILGTFIGIMLLMILNAGLILMRAPASWFQAFVGLLIVIAVIFNIILERRRK